MQGLPIPSICGTIAAAYVRQRNRVGLLLAVFVSLWRRRLWVVPPGPSSRIGEPRKMRVAVPLSIIVNGYPDIRDRISRNTEPA
jgi:hypothetical protein